MKNNPWILLAAISLALAAGCLGLNDEKLDEQSLDPAQAENAYNISSGWSTPAQPPQYDMLESEHVLVDSFDDTPISMAIFLPDKQECDWEGAIHEGEQLPDECALPTVMTASPYWGPNIHEDSYRPPIATWLVPQGYAVVHMSLRGTGDSGGCMEFGSMNEQRDVDEMLDWTAEQEWSTGEIGMMGRSYVGTTPWYGAAFGNENLKTIVPIHGITDWSKLMFKNGTSETRGPILHTFFTLNYGLGLDDGGEPDRRSDHWLDQLACVDTWEGAAYGPSTKATADASHEYWQERAMQDRILENYNGSAWIIQGLHDWNVNPSQQVPFLNDLENAGIETKAWLGVWAHDYPDRVDEQHNLRWDWATTVVNWFDHHLKGENVDTGPSVEVQDSLLTWRTEEHYPPKDATMLELEIGADNTIQPAGDAQPQDYILASTPTSTTLGTTQASTTLTFTTDPLEDDLRIAGLPQFHTTVTPTTPAGGSLFAQLYHVWPDGVTMEIGWAAIDVRNHEGGNTHEDPLIPGEPVIAKMQFEPLDAIVPAEHQLMLVMHKHGVHTVDPSPYDDPLIVHAGNEQSMLRLPTIDRPHIVIEATPPSLPPTTNTNPTPTP